MSKYIEDKIKEFDRDFPSGHNPDAVDYQELHYAFEEFLKQALIEQRERLVLDEKEVIGAIEKAHKTVVESQKSDDGSGQYVKDINDEIAKAICSLQDEVKE